MTEQRPDRFDVRAVGELAREFTTRWQATVEQFMRAGTGAEAADTHDAGAHMRSMLELGINVSREPIEQMRALAETLKKHRTEIGRMQTQLQAFDEQLALVEETLQPMLQWNEQWVQAQGAVLSSLGFATDDT